jgi:cyanobactin cluster PatC/TenC/TruC protein
MMQPNDDAKTTPDATQPASTADPTEPPRSTGLGDYGYWLCWKQSLPAPGPGDGKPFRRGHIWR